MGRGNLVERSKSSSASVGAGDERLHRELRQKDTTAGWRHAGGELWDGQGRSWYSQMPIWVFKLKLRRSRSSSSSS